MTEIERELQFARGHIAALEQLLEVHEQTALEQSARLEQSRADLIRVFEQAPAAIAATEGPEHIFRTANPKYRELVGNRELVGKSARQVFPELATGPLFDLLDQVFRTGEPVIGTEVPVDLDRPGNGETELFYFNFVYQPLFESEKKVWGIMIHAIEVTEQVEARHRLEETARALRILTDALERSNKELDQFAYVASHDLKAPLRGIANLAQWIQEDVGDRLTGDSIEHMRLLHGRVQRMEALIDGILTYSRAARTKAAAEAVDTGMMLRDVIDLIAPEGVEIKVPESMPTVLAEKVPLQQVFMNLVGNAIKYGRGDPAVLTVAAKENEGFAEFSICDNGPGIAPEFHERIWGIFQTLEARDKVEGTGIGLAVVRKIVESRGGLTRVESELGKGACFYFTWPMAAREKNNA
ncbi:MAG: PAS domain-containing protein [Gemmatimonadaceae bacterium]|nr:PAS domain-containing protein [Gemmatimonadaceae bacterium]